MANPADEGIGAEWGRSRLPINRYPRPGTVSIYLGFSAESLKAPRSLFTVTWRPCSKSTNVPFFQICSRNCSLVTTSPGCDSRISRILEGWLDRRIRTPLLSNTPAAPYTSKGPKASRGCDCAGGIIKNRSAGHKKYTPDARVPVRLTNKCFLRFRQCGELCEAKRVAGAPSILKTGETLARQSGG